MTNIDRDVLLSNIKNLRCGSLNGVRRPHKIIFLLSIIEIYSKKDFDNIIPLTPLLEDTFQSLWNRHVHDIPFLSALIELPYYHLQGDSFWTLKLKPQKAIEFNSYERITRKRILECVEYGSFNSLWASAICNVECQNLIKEALLLMLRERSMNMQTQHTVSFDNVINSIFVSYINSLHCIDANSDGALAESQAKNPLFHGIQVKHPWSQEFANRLQQSSDKSHIVLTGHAGDGKSTIALELYKILTHNEGLESLPSGLPKRVDISDNITIIKDLSEWTDADQDGIFLEMASGSRRFVLISNTGCLLSLFRRQAPAIGKSTVTVEDELLTALDAPAGTQLKTKAGIFEINNLARLDNIDAALDMFRFMVTSPLWDNCIECSLHPHCPVFQNVRIVRQYKERILARIRLLLRRIVDYGNRLTMRQLSAHFAYILTSGLDCEKIAAVLQKKQSFPLEQHLFFNRFWGDDGWQKDVNATQLKTDRLISEQGFGTVYAPSMERRLWLRSDKVSFDLGIPELSSIFKRLLSTALSTSPTHYQARSQIRRMVYFFFENSSLLRETELFLSSFLNSPMLCEYQSWLKDISLFNRKRNNLKDQLFHVLQEQFSGIKLPEGISNDKTLYITLNRRQRNIRQSSQILLGKIDFNDLFEVIIPNNGKTELILAGKGAFSDIKMPLALPFLDYIFVRKSGGIGSILQVAYVDRLENLKSEMLQHCQAAEYDQLLLLKLDANNVLRRQRMMLTETSLEVSNG